MARIKQSPHDKQRITWTRLHLSCTMTWFKWSNDYSDLHVGKWANVVGCLRVVLGRLVENPEQAVLSSVSRVLGSLWDGLLLTGYCLTVWQSADSIASFEFSPACEEPSRDLRRSFTPSIRMASPTCIAMAVIRILTTVSAFLVIRPLKQRGSVLGRAIHAAALISKEAHSTISRRQVRSQNAASASSTPGISPVSEPPLHVCFSNFADDVCGVGIELDPDKDSWTEIPEGQYTPQNLMPATFASPEE